jgi:dTDP-4-dehydrorhamnose 3,5-epimerase-like enzyme
MAKLIPAKTVADPRGALTVLDRDLPFSVKRIYYIYGVDRNVVRAGHRHKKNTQALICVSGSCEVFVNDGVSKQTYVLDRPDQYLLLETRDWHTMRNFSLNAVLLVLASEHYDVNDYIDEEYK